MTRRSWGLFAAMCLIWGVPYLLIRVAVRDFSPGALVFARCTLGGLILVPFALRQGGYRPVLRRWRPLVAFSIIELAVPWLLLSDAERVLSSSFTGLVIAAVPLVGVVVAFVARSSDRGGGPVRYAGLLLGLVGVILLLGLDVGDLRIGAVLELLVVVIGYAVAPVIMARRLSDLPSMPVVSAALLGVGLVYLPYGVLTWPDSISARAGWSVVALAIVCTALAFVVFFALIAEIGPARATVFTYVNPAVALLLGVLLLDERMTLGIAIGFPLILLGSVLAARAGARRPGMAPAQTAVAEGCVVQPLAADGEAGTPAVSSVDADVAGRRGESGRDETTVALEG